MKYNSHDKPRFPGRFPLVRKDLIFSVAKDIAFPYLFPKSGNYSFFVEPARVLMIQTSLMCHIELCFSSEILNTKHISSASYGTLSVPKKQKREMFRRIPSLGKTQLPICGIALSSKENIPSTINTIFVLSMAILRQTIRSIRFDFSKMSVEVYRYCSEQDNR